MNTTEPTQKKTLESFAPFPWENTGKSKNGSYYKVRGTRLGTRFKIADIPFNSCSETDEKEAREIANFIASGMHCGAAVLAGLPQGELSEEEVTIAAHEAFQAAVKLGFFERLEWHAMKWQDRRDYIGFAKCLLSSRPSAPLAIHKTAERPPTKEDSTKLFVLAWDGQGWERISWFYVADNAIDYPYWQKQLPAPTPELSEEEAAFEAHLATDGLDETLSDVKKDELRRVWSAAKAYFQQENKEK